MVGLALTHTDPIMVPPGMKRIFLGSNPIAFGAPGGDGPAVIVDMSTTHAAWGKVIVARQEGKPIPPDWAVDAEGKATTDATHAVGLAPDRRAQGLRARDDGGDPLRACSPACRSACTSPRCTASSTSRGTSATSCWRWTSRRFTDLGTFRSQIDLLLAEIQAESALAPGEPERLTAARREKEGVPIGEATLGELNALAAQLGVAAV